MVVGFTDNGIEARGFIVQQRAAKLAGTVDRCCLSAPCINSTASRPRPAPAARPSRPRSSLLRTTTAWWVVQHRAPPSEDESGTDGSRGYLEEADVIEMFEDAGFQLVDSSDINANPADQPGPRTPCGACSRPLRTSQMTPNCAPGWKP